MHPALSVIVFTTSSGAGYGLLILLALGSATGSIPPERGLGLVGLGTALGLIGFGLLASTRHLGRPERAWRAFSQWRSSWLSREAVAAVATFVPAGLLALGWILLERAWAWAGMLSAAGSLTTLVSTAMIYASLRPIPRWSNGWTVPIYLALGLETGAALLLLILALFGQPVLRWAHLAAAFTALGVALKLGYWGWIDGPGTAGPTPESATGLGALGRVRLLEAPHTEENYLLKEMGFRIARKHAAKLRRVAAAGLGIALALMVLVALGMPPMLPAVLAVLAAGLGVLVERWLFFAEARHTVTLYYGGSARGAGAAD